MIFFQKKVLSSDRSEIHLVRGNITYLSGFEINYVKAWQSKIMQKLRLVQNVTNTITVAGE